MVDKDLAMVLIEMSQGMMETLLILVNSLDATGAIDRSAIVEALKAGMDASSAEENYWGDVAKNMLAEAIEKNEPLVRFPV